MAIIRFDFLQVVDNHWLLEIPRRDGNDRRHADALPVESGGGGVGRVTC
jgi:hypothetical protein